MFRFTNFDDKDWFDDAQKRVCKQYLGDEMLQEMAEEPYFVDFMRDAPEPTGEEADDADLEAPKIYEIVRICYDFTNFYFGCTEDFIALIHSIQWTIANPVGADRPTKRQKKTSCVSTGRPVPVLCTRQVHCTSFLFIHRDIASFSFVWRMYCADGFLC